MNWKEVEGFQEEKPLEYEVTDSTVYFRRNIRAVPNEDEGTHWKYDEAEIIKSDFNIIAQAAVLENQLFQKKVLAEILKNVVEV